MKLVKELGYWKAGESGQIEKSCRNCINSSAERIRVWKTSEEIVKVNRKVKLIRYVIERITKLNTNDQIFYCSLRDLNVQWHSGMFCPFWRCRKCSAK